jgi:hypothetical protein
MALKEATDDDWKGDVRLIGKRNSSPFQPTAVEERAGITRWKKFKAAIRRKAHSEPVLKNYSAKEP